MNNRWLVVLFLGNVVDAAATAYVLQHGLGVEFNPLVRFLYGWHPVAFFLVKTVAVAVAFWAVNGEPEKHRLTLAAVAVFYGFLSLYQIVALIFL